MNSSNTIDHSCQEFSENNFSIPKNISFNLEASVMALIVQSPEGFFEDERFGYPGGDWKSAETYLVAEGFELHSDGTFRRGEHTGTVLELIAERYGTTTERAAFAVLDHMAHDPEWRDEDAILLWGELTLDAADEENPDPDPPSIEWQRQYLTHGILQGATRGKLYAHMYRIIVDCDNPGDRPSDYESPSVMNEFHSFLRSKKLEDDDYREAVRAWEEIINYNRELRRRMHKKRQEAATAKPEQKTRPKIKVYSAADLMAMDFQEPRWIIPGIIPEGVSLIAAPPKAGKSWLALDLALTISIGGVCLNRPVDQAGSLYLALEDTPRRIKARIQKQSCLEPLPINPKYCHILTEWAPDGEGFVRLHHYLDENPQTRIILIDTYGRFAASRDNNDYSEATRILAGIKSFSDEHGVSVVLVHHTRKNHEGEDFINASVGSVGIVGGVDNILILNRKRNQPDGILKITGRDVEEAELAVHFDNMTCRWSVQGNASEVAETKERQDVLDALNAAREPLTPKDIAAALGKNPSTTRWLLMKMVESGQIIKLFSGKYTISTNTPNSTNSTNTPNTPNGGKLF